MKANAGHVADALRRYRDLIDYWHRSGNWTQQWVTLRNLAQLLRRLGDNQPAALLDAAAEQRRTHPRPTSPRTHPRPSRPAHGHASHRDPPPSAGPAPSKQPDRPSMTG